MKQEYTKPICEQFVVFAENALLSGSPKKIGGEGYGSSVDDDENWG